MALVPVPMQRTISQHHKGWSVLAKANDSDDVDLTEVELELVDFS